MDKQKFEISEELNKLKAYIGRDVSSMSAEEINIAKKEIQKSSQNIEEILTRQAGLPRNAIINLINDMNERFAFNASKNIRDTREHEYDASSKNIDIVQKDDAKGNSAKVSQIEQTGLITNDRQYEQKIEQISDEIFIEYKMRLSKLNSRQVDNAIYDIRGVIRNTTIRLCGIHDSFSKDIKKIVEKRVAELGERVNEDLLDQVEKEVVRIGKEHGVIPEEPETAVIIDSNGTRHEITDSEALEKLKKEDERAAQGFNDFARKMQGLTVSDEDLARQDSQKLEDKPIDKNEKTIEEEPIV